MSCYYEVEREFEEGESIPIGRPFKNTEILLLDGDNKIPKKGEPGEICIRGTALTLGYYKDKERTDQVFVQNPLNDCYHELIYRTGDIGKYNEYGELLFLSRKDCQIKHMGHRIELGEIETAVSSFCEVHRCCCFYDELRHRIVLAVESDIEITKSEIRERLQQQIPEYMLPGEVLYISKLPLNSNGKIDRKKLKADMC